MAFSKAHKFDDAVYHFSLMCRALSHPARIIILKRLIDSDGDKVTAGALIEGLPISRQTASGHLRMLREMSIINCEEQHPHTCYSLNSDLLNTWAGIFSLVMQADSKYDDNYLSEIEIVGARRTIGTTPV